jgi:hypothetical protein
MRKQLEKLKKSNSTKAERRFMEILKKNHIPFKAKVRVKNREIDFLIGKYAIDIDGHKQVLSKNDMLVWAGFIPVHISNKELKNNDYELPKWIK